MVIVKLDRIKLRELRRSKRVGSATLAGMVGVGRTYFSRVENGSDVPSQELIARIARTLGVPASAICVEDSGAESIRAKAMELSGNDPIVLRAVDLLLELSEPERYRQIGAIADAVEAEKRKSTLDAEKESSAVERKPDVSAKNRP